MSQGLQIEPTPEYRGLLEFAHTITVGGLSRERTLGRGQKLFRKAALVADTRIHEVIQYIDRMPPEKRDQSSPKCADGCAHCCSQWVRATAIEVLVVADAIRKTWSAERVEVLLGRLKDYRATFMQQTPGRMFSLACPLLTDNKCPVYSVRPFICRGCNSMDVDACLKGKEDPNSGVLVPTIMPILLTAGAVREGVKSGLHAAGYAQSEMVFAFGLHTALEVPDAAEKYFAGEPIFANDLIPPGF